MVEFMGFVTIFILFFFYFHPSTFCFSLFFLERKREIHRLVAFCTHLDLESAPGPWIVPACARARAWTGDPMPNLGVRPAQESNAQPFSYSMMFQPTKPHWLGLSLFFKCFLKAHY